MSVRQLEASTGMCSCVLQDISALLESRLPVLLLSTNLSPARITVLNVRRATLVEARAPAHLLFVQRGSTVQKALIPRLPAILGSTTISRACGKPLTV